MDPEKENLVTPEEQKAEQEALAEAKDEQIRADVVASLGLEDNDANSEFIEKLVEREKSHRTKLSEAIGQKINWRNKAKGPKTETPANQERKETPSYDPEAARKQTEATVRAELEQRDLDEMEHSDEVKAEIKKIAQVKGISVRKAEKDPYIQYLIGEGQQAERVSEAAVSRKPRSTSAAQTLSTDKPQFNLATEEGRKAFKEWKDKRRR